MPDQTAIQFHLKSQHCNDDVAVEIGRYHDMSTAVVLVDVVTGEQIATATVCVQGSKLADDEVLLKGWSENTGIPQALEGAGLVEETGRELDTGWVTANVYRMKGALLEAVTVARAAAEAGR